MQTNTSTSIYNILKMNDIDATIRAGRELLACRYCHEQVGHLHAANCGFGNESDIVRAGQSELRRSK